MTFIRVRNFEKFQHYKHRNPPWIRLYFELLGDKDFYKLSAKLKFQIIGLFLLASKCDNKIAADPRWIQSRIHSVEPVNIQDLIKTTFIETCEDASNMLAGCRQDASNLRTNDVSETDSSDDSDDSDVQSQSQIALARGPTPAPKQFEVTEELREWANSQGFDNPTIERETSAMLDHFRGNGKRKHDWVATWRNWLRNSPKYGVGVQRYARRETAAEAKDRERDDIDRRVRERFKNAGGLLSGNSN